MSLNTLFDEGDRQRVEREETLTEQLPRQPIAEDKTPMDDMETDFLLEGLMEALKARLI